MRSKKRQFQLLPPGLSSPGTRQICVQTAGVSIENFLQKGKPTRVPPAKVIDFLMNKLNKTQVRMCGHLSLFLCVCVSGSSYK